MFLSINMSFIIEGIFIQSYSPQLTSTKAIFYGNWNLFQNQKWKMDINIAVCLKRQQGVYWWEKGTH